MTRFFQVRSLLFLTVAGFLLAAPTKIGADKCKMCHKVQYESWQTSKHAAKGLDCEGCHGAGSDYKTMSVMKNLEAAKKAGLIVPTMADCGKCHGKGGVAAMTPALFTKSHAHKAK
jgi:RecJ-like exonuclease